VTLPLTNQGFDTNVSGWTAGGNPAVFEWQNGKAHLIAGVGTGWFEQSIGTLATGTEFTVHYRVNDIALANVKAVLSGAAFMSGTEYGVPGTYTQRFVIATPGTYSLRIQVTAAGGEMLIDWVYGSTNMAGFFSIAMLDRDDDSRQFTLPTTQVTAANHDAQYALAQALVAGVEGISRLVTDRWDFGARRTETGDPRPTAGSAQVNIEWQVTYVEATTLEVRTVRIGGANLDISGILLPSSNIADLTATEMAAFVSAFEAYVLGPNGNAVTVQQVAFLE
jgi:hypothetical protein